MLQVLSEGFALGASTGIACAGTCVPFLVPYLMTDERTKIRECAGLLFQFLSGRLLAYVLFGLVAGWLGGQLRPYVSETIRAWALIVTAVLLLFTSLKGHSSAGTFCVASFSKKISPKTPFFLGVLLGLNICPPFLLGMARLAEYGTATAGALFFTAFFAASSFYLIPFFIFKPLVAGQRVRFIGRTVSALVGLWYLGTGITALFL